MVLYINMNSLILPKWIISHSSTSVSGTLKAGVGRVTQFFKFLFLSHLLFSISFSVLFFFLPHLLGKHINLNSPKLNNAFNATQLSLTSCWEQPLTVKSCTITVVFLLRLRDILGTGVRLHSSQTVEPGHEPLRQGPPEPVSCELGRSLPRGCSGLAPANFTPASDPTNDPAITNLGLTFKSKCSNQSSPKI